MLKQTENEANFVNQTENEPNFGRKTENEAYFVSQTENEANFGRKKENEANFGRKTENYSNFGRKQTRILNKISEHPSAGTSQTVATRRPIPEHARHRRLRHRQHGTTAIALLRPIASKKTFKCMP